MKKALSVLLAILMLMGSFCMVTSADSEIDIFIDGVKLQCDQAPYIENGRTMIPMRKIFESLNSTVEWEGSTQTITATKGDTQIVLQIGQPTLYKNGVVEALDVSPIIKDGSTFVPARAVAQALGTNVDWFDESSTVFITSKDTEVIKDFPAIILPDWNELEVVEDPYGGDYSYAIYSGKDEMVDENIPRKIVGVLEDWFDALEDNGWVKTQPKDTYHYMDYDFLVNKKSDILYGFKFYLGVSSYGWDHAYYGFKIQPVYYRIIYKNNGEYMKVLFDDIDNYVYYGSEWQLADYEKITIYDSNNNTKTLYEYEAAPLLNAGWSTEQHMVTMYAPDGDTITIGVHEIAAYQNVGWYTEPVVTMYAPDGRTITVFQAEAAAYRNVGWYDTQYEAEESNRPKESQSDVYNPSADGCYYRTPTGKRYHLDPNCGGKNSYRTTNISGLSPCSKCAK